MPFKHNKKRNSALVYEFLLRRMTSQIIDEDKRNLNTTFSVIKRYFGKGSVLSREKELFDVVRKVRGVDENIARKILCEMKNHASKIDQKELDIKKSNLIKEINYTYGKGFFSEHRIPEYKLLATIQMIIDASRTERCISEDVQRIQLEEALVKFMTIKSKQLETFEQEQKIDPLVLVLAEKRFQEKYGNVLNDAQKKLLCSYVRYNTSNNKTEALSFINEEIKNICASLDCGRSMKEIEEDKIMLQRLDEASTSLKNMRVDEKNVDDAVQEIMLYQKLVEELNSDVEKS